MILFKMIFITSVMTGLIVNGCNSKGKSKEIESHSMSSTELPDSSLLGSLKKVIKRQFIGKSVEIFLANKPVNAFKDYVFIDEKIGLLSYLSLDYGSKINIEIVVSEYKHMEPFDIKRRWKLELFKKEKIGEIRLLHNDIIVESVK